MPAERRIRIVCISDTHNDDPTGHIPDGDVLVHAGDMTDDGTAEELEKAIGWIRNLPHKLKVIIPGETTTIYITIISD
jgi:3',5'-cyclic AMP phosphodiesterase CpdA